MLTQKPDLFSYQPPLRYPEAPAEGKTETSKAAADIIRKAHTSLQMDVLRYIARRLDGATWKECAASMGENDRNIQPRFSELKELGLIVGTGLRRERCEVMKVAAQQEKEAQK